MNLRQVNQRKNNDVLSDIESELAHVSFCSYNDPFNEVNFTYVSTSKTNLTLYWDLRILTSQR